MCEKYTFITRIASWFRYRLDDITVIINQEPILFLQTDTEGHQYWYIENKLLHRTYGPSCVYPHNTHRWFSPGYLHREDGPAVIWQWGLTEWFLNGRQYSFTEWIYQLQLDEATALMLRIKWNQYQ